MPACTLMAGAERRCDLNKVASASCGASISVNSGRCLFPITTTATLGGRCTRTIRHCLPTMRMRKEISCVDRLGACSALLSGILRCGHCGAKLLAQYPGPAVIRYQCGSNLRDPEATCCVSFGGLKADRLISEQALECVKPLALQASLQAIESLQGARDERLHHKELALQQARYEVTQAQHQYDAVDPSNRLVAAELERRWNEALKLKSQIEEELAALQRQQCGPLSDATREELLALGHDLRRLWDHPKSPPEFKKRVLRTVLKEIIASSDGDTVRMVLHWQGGDHTELTLQKTLTGRNRYVTDADTVELIRSLARIQPDSMIASILNRMGRRTGHGQSWNAKRVCAMRYHHA